MRKWNLASASIRKDVTQSEPRAEGLSALEQFFFMNPLREIYSKVKHAQGAGLLESLLSEMQITLRVAPEELAAIPNSGPVLVVANHPFGILDGAILGALLLRIRFDVKILTNYLVASIGELAKHCIHVDPFDRPESRRVNIAGLRQAISHLKGGGMLAMFPAGEVSHWQFRHGEVTDPDWNTDTARLARLSGASVLPVLFEGRNSVSFHALGLIHPKLRTIQLPKEFLNKVGKEIRIAIGTPVPVERIRRIPSDPQATSYLRWRTYLLGRRVRFDTEAPKKPASLLKSINVAKFVRHSPPRPVEAVVASPDAEAIGAEIERLGAAGEMDENRDFQVFVADGANIPQCLIEIGRQREITFRDAGEGTGKSLDLDRFDSYYKHLMLWSKKDNRIAGGYRFANTGEVLRRQGLQGLYTTTLFWIDPEFFDHTGPALELGRSFVCREYQRQYGSLLMMWRGIGSYLSQHPETPVLFGPVSMSSTYRRTSRELLFEFFRNQRANPLSQYVRSRRPFRARAISDWEVRAIRHLLDVEEVSSSIAEIEGDGKGVPVLLRQYLKLGGELLAFNVDKDFSDVLDGLVLVDLRRTDPARLETYMGKERMEAFLSHHAAKTELAAVDRAG
jgi:putative hemolysin